MLWRYLWDLHVHGTIILKTNLHNFCKQCPYWISQTRGKRFSRWYQVTAWQAWPLHLPFFLFNSYRTYTNRILSFGPYDLIPQLTVGSWLTTGTGVSFVPRNRTSFFPVARPLLPDTRGRTTTIALNKSNHAHCLILYAKQRQVPEVLAQLSTCSSLKLKLQTARAATVYLPALRTTVSVITTLNCWDYTASPDRTLLMN